MSSLQRTFEHEARPWLRAVLCQGHRDRLSDLLTFSLFELDGNPVVRDAQRRRCIADGEPVPAFLLPYRLAPVTTWEVARPVWASIHFCGQRDQLEIDDAARRFMELAEAAGLSSQTGGLAPLFEGVPRRHPWPRRLDFFCLLAVDPFTAAETGGDFIPASEAQRRFGFKTYKRLMGFIDRHGIPTRRPTRRRLLVDAGKLAEAVAQADASPFRLCDVSQELADEVLGVEKRKAEMRVRKRLETPPRK